MPKAMEQALKKQAAKKGLKGEAADRYVYGAMQNQGMLERDPIKRATSKYRKSRAKNRPM